MPLPDGTRYRFKKGTNTRLAFGAGGKVLEAKNMKTGATHTPAEFEEDAETSSKTQNTAEEKAEAQKAHFRGVHRRR